MRSLKFLLVFVAITSTAYAGVATFDFESTPYGFNSGSLVVSNGGLTLTITPQGDPTGFIYIGNPGVALLGSHSAVGSQVNSLQSDMFDPLRFTFSSPVTSITFAFGDAGGDDDSPVVITGYDAGNNPLGTLTTSYPSGFGAGKTLSGSFANASYFILTSGPHTPGSNSDSIYWEVPTVTFGAIPEPGTLVLFGSGLLGLAGAVRRKLML
jgi:PEP-CTERM motif